MALTKVGKEGITNISNSSDATAITIDSSENVGIGTTSPQVALHVEAASSSGKLRLSKGTVSSADDGVGSIQFRAGNTTAAANINGRTDASGTGNGAIQFSTGTTSSLNEAMRITSGGLVGIGTSSPSILFEVAGNVNANYIGSFHNDGNDANRYVLRLAGGSDSGSGTSYLAGLQDGDFNSVGSITHSGGNASFNTSSDHRLKENVVDMTGAIDRVKSLAPKRFNFIRNPDITVDGFIAHEAQAVVPGAVSGTHNEVDADDNPVYQGIDQSKLVPLLTGALQEAIAKIEALETRVTALESA